MSTYAQYPKVVRYLSYFLFAYAVYAFVFGTYTILDDYLIPAMLNDASRARLTVLWPLALISLVRMAIEVTLSLLAYTGLARLQARGWWLAGAISINWIISASMSTAQILLLVPDGMNVYANNPMLLPRTLFFVVTGGVLLWFLFRQPVMQEVGIQADNRLLALTKVAGLGLILALLYLAVVMVGTWIMALVLG